MIRSLEQDLREDKSRNVIKRPLQGSYFSKIIEDREKQRGGTPPFIRNKESYRAHISSIGKIIILLGFITDRFRIRILCCASYYQSWPGFMVVDSQSEDFISLLLFLYKSIAHIYFIHHIRIW